MREQGTLVECPYCQYLHPELKASSKCPKCHGSGPRFAPARMMDKQTSQREMWNELMEIAPLWQEYQDGKKPSEEMFSAMLNFLSKVKIYNFDIQSALITLLLDLERSK